MDTRMPSKPRQGYRPCSLYLRSDQWDRLRVIEAETGASPSFTVRKLIDSLDRKRRSRQADQPPPAA